ncbi:hypothetical protein [Pseudoduganella namucuonensis]|uniref:Transmembrane protein n=1 Tax=Pseudoduganella namucuonensis TaxID=1035707 RepID=A0A1I7FMM4_9BURK|nr:hypothetical protein [Pseudoduganella namucuonensis]SFU37462.1 hypothetical protein SAMN05216552_1002153 [Pseudoduganella namucuonensis]
MNTPGPHAAVYGQPSAAAIPAADASHSGVSWSAVIAGAAAAAALSFILLVLGVGLGLSAVSPWSYSDAPIGKSTILWISFMELASAGVGGYMAGRLRTRWSGVHADEVYFRDTAHGLLAWAVATLLTAALMAGAVRAVLSGAIDAGAGAATATAAANGDGKSQAGTAPQEAAAALAPKAPAAGVLKGAPGSDYYADMLLRSDAMPVPDAASASLRSELVRILDNAATGTALPADERQYLARLVSKRAGLEPSDAERRVDDVYASLVKARNDAEVAAKAAADKARKAGALSALWMFFALLLGAFIAALAATFGGKQRDYGVPPRR